MRQSACPVLDDNKHVQHPERRGDRNEEVTCENRLCMVPKEGAPALITARLAWRSLRHVFADRSRRDRISSLTNNSLAILSWPHNGFSAAILRIKPRNSGG